MMVNAVREAIDAKHLHEYNEKFGDQLRTIDDVVLRLTRWTLFRVVGLDII
jgi:hypothetical protein